MKFSFENLIPSKINSMLSVDSFDVCSRLKPLRNKQLTSCYPLAQKFPIVLAIFGSWEKNSLISIRCVYVRKLLAPLFITQSEYNKAAVYVLLCERQLDGRKPFCLKDDSSDINNNSRSNAAETSSYLFISLCNPVSHTSLIGYFSDQ